MNPFFQVIRDQLTDHPILSILGGPDSVLFASRTIVPQTTAPGHEYSIVFGEGLIDLSGDLRRRHNRSRSSDARNVSFGDLLYETPARSAGEPQLEIDVSAVFAAVRVINKESPAAIKPPALVSAETPSQ